MFVFVFKVLKFHAVPQLQPKMLLYSCNAFRGKPLHKLLSIVIVQLVLPRLVLMKSWSVHWIERCLLT